MIKPNVIAILLIVCALLAAGVFLIDEERPKPTQDFREGSVLVKDFAPENVKGIHIVKGGTEIKLEKKDKNWTLASHQNRPAKLDRIDAFLNNVKAAKQIGQRTGGDDTFGLDEKSRILATLTTESGKTELYLGKSPEWGKAFVRTEAKGPTLEIDKPLDTDASARTEGNERVIDVQHFYDLKIVNIPQDDIVEVAIQRKNAAGADETVKLQRVEIKPDPNKPPEPKIETPPNPHGHGGTERPEKKDEPKIEWWIQGDKKIQADEASVNSITSNLSNLNAKAYADNVKAEDRGLDKPAAKVTLKTKDGKEHVITFGKQTGDEVVLQASGNNEVFLAYKYVLENVQKDLVKKEEAKDTTVSPITPLVPPAEPSKSEPKPAPAKTEDKPAPAIPQNKVEDKTQPALPPAVVKPPEEKKK